MNALFPIAELANLICASTALHRLVGVMRGYFDDSGTHRGSPIVAAAGLVGAATEWTALETRWLAKLADYGLSDFNAAKCAEGEPPYHRLKETERDSLVRELANLISDHHLLPISSAVHIQPWSGLWASNLPARRAFFDRYPRPFALCFDHCLQVIANWTKTVADGEAVSLVFNEQRSDAAGAAEVFDVYKASKRWGVGLDTLTFAPSRGRPPLQAADLLANETFHYWLDLTTDPQIPLRPALAILWRRFDFGQARFYDLTALIQAIRQFAP